MGWPSWFGEEKMCQLRRIIIADGGFCGFSYIYMIFALFFVYFAFFMPFLYFWKVFSLCFVWSAAVHLFFCLSCLPRSATYYLIPERHFLPAVFYFLYFGFLVVWSYFLAALSRVLELHEETESEGRNSHAQLTTLREQCKSNTAKSVRTIYQVHWYQFICPIFWARFGCVGSCVGATTRGDGKRSQAISCTKLTTLREHCRSNTPSTYYQYVLDQLEAILIALCIRTTNTTIYSSFLQYIPFIALFYSICFEVSTVPGYCVPAYRKRIPHIPPNWPHTLTRYRRKLIVALLLYHARGQLSAMIMIYDHPMTRATGRGCAFQPKRSHLGQIMI